MGGCDQRATTAATALMMAAAPAAAPHTARVPLIQDGHRIGCSSKSPTIAEDELTLRAWDSAAVQLLGGAPPVLDGRLDEARADDDESACAAV